MRFGSAQLAELPAADSPAGVSLRDAIRGGIEVVNAEDRATVGAVQRGGRARAAGQGFLSEFERYLAARLARA